jgi:hypothetical protein
MDLGAAVSRDGGVWLIGDIVLYYLVGMIYFFELLKGYIAETETVGYRKIRLS